MDIAVFASCSAALRSACHRRCARNTSPATKFFVDYSGKKVPIVDRKTGEIREAELFLGVLGASSYCTRGRSVILASCFASVDFPAPGQPTIKTRFISCPPFEALPAPLVGTTAIGQFNLQRVLAAFARQKQRSVLCQVGAGFDAERKHSRLISSPDSKLVQLVASERQADGYVEFTVADNDRIRFRNFSRLSTEFDVLLVIVTWPRWIHDQFCRKELRKTRDLEVLIQKRIAVVQVIDYCMSRRAKPPVCHCVVNPQHLTKDW